MPATLFQRLTLTAALLCAATVALPGCGMFQSTADSTAASADRSDTDPMAGHEPMVRGQDGDPMADDPMADDGDMLEPAPRAGQDGDGRAEDLLREAEERKLREMQAEQSTAEALAEAARAAFNRSRFEQAYELAVEALAKDPENALAQEIKQNAGLMIGRVAPGPNHPALERAVDEALLRIGMARRDAMALVAEARRLMDQEDYEMAIERLDRALIVLEQRLADDADMRALEDEARDLREEAGRLAEIKAERDRRAAAEAARLAAQLEEEQREQLQQQKARNLFERAIDAFQMRDYDNSLRLAEQLLQLDPTHREARELRELSIRAQHELADDEISRRKMMEWRRSLADMQKQVTPQTTTVAYDVQKWVDEVVHRTAPRFEDFGDEETEEERLVLNSLAGKSVTLDFRREPLESVVNFLSDLSGINMVISPAVYEEKDEDELEVSLTVERLPLEKALELILKLKGLSYKVEPGPIVIVTTQKEAEGAPVLQIYPVQDLVQRLLDFPGPEIELASDEDAGIGIGLGGDEGSGIDADELADLIEEIVEPDSWGEDGTSIEPRSGSLIIRQTPRIHAQVQRLLNDLRASTGKLVTIETRFLQVTDNFLQDVGVDWRGLGDQSAAGSEAGSGDGTKTLTDFLANGARTTPAAGGIGGDNTGGFFFGDGSELIDPVTGNAIRDLENQELRARVENVFDNAASFGDARALNANGGLFAQYAIIDDIQAQAVIRAAQKTDRTLLMTSPAVTLFNTQRGHVLITNQFAYVEDFDVEIAVGSVIADPLIATIQSGLVLDVRPIISADNRFITLELRPTMAVLTNAALIRAAVNRTPGQPGSGGGLTVNIGGGSTVFIEMPILQIQRLKTTVTVPDNGTLMLGGQTTVTDLDYERSVPLLENMPVLRALFQRRNKSVHRTKVVILVTARITILEELEADLGLPTNR